MRKLILRRDSLRLIAQRMKPYFFLLGSKRRSLGRGAPLLGLLFLFFIIISSGYCAAQDELVYLTVKSVAVSSFDATADWAPLPDANALIDGNLLTRWASSYTDNQWICFDFGGPKVLSKVVIFWEAAYAADYDILVSMDKENWRTVSSLKGQDGNIDGIDFLPTQARFVKLVANKRANPDWGISIWEFMCFGPAKENTDDKPLKEVYPHLVDKLNQKQTLPSAVILKREEPLVSPGALSLEEFQKGIVYTSWDKRELATPASDNTLEYLKSLGVRHLSIMVVWFQDTIEEKVIYPDPKDTPDDNALIHAINKAHSLGIKVMLKPHVDIKSGQWRGDIIPSAEWFSSYKNYLSHYVRLASQYNVEVICIGTELLNATLPQWESQWDIIIREIRENFSGRLVYAANWDEYEGVGFWDKLDFVGIDAYFPLTKSKEPTKEELVAAWEDNASKIEKWLREKEINKPVVFTEVGYCSADGTNIQPWSVLSNLSEDFIDQQEQADSLEAMVFVCSGCPWFKGFYWWNYFPQDRWSPLGYTIKGKKAEEVFSAWLNKL